MQKKTGAIPKRGDFDSTIRSLPRTTCDKRVEDPRSAFNFAGKIHFPTTVSGESSVSENLAPDALENCEINRILSDPDDEKMTHMLTHQHTKTNIT